LESAIPRRHRYAVIAIVCALAIFAAACGSKKDSGGGTTASTGASSNITLADNGQPQSGGSLTMGLEAEDSGYNPTVDRWDISGTEIGLAIYDPLVAFDANSQPQPYLAQSITPNSDFTVWTITVRPNIKFHDGTALNGAAITTMFNAHLKSALTQPALSPITKVETTGELTSQITMKTSWVTFPYSLTSQLGMVPAPSSFDSAGKPTDASSKAPVGTGPFVFANWTPDKSFKATKNPTYWRTGLPYLDAIEFRPIPDSGTRSSALQTGDINMMHTSDFTQVLKFRDLAKQGRAQIVEDNGEGEEDFLIVNTADPAVKDVRVRKAMALALDRDTFNQVINAGIGEDANSVFKPTSKWYTKTDYPDYDPAAAKALVDQYIADTGTTPTFTIGTTPSPINQQAVQLVQQDFQAAGMKVDVKTTEQSQFITDGVLGHYQVNLWRQFGAVDPDADAQWWYSANAGDGSAKGGLTLNIARNKDPKIDAALDKGRQSSDEATRKQAYADLQTQMATDFPYIWIDHALWAVVAGNNVRGITNGPLPDGQPSLPIGGGGDFGGVVRFTQTWLTGA
jgi:peptide/nickel transport system substrate-binding protein